MDKFTQAYVECALWDEIDSDDTPLGHKYTVNDLSTSTRLQMIEDCELFQALHKDDLSKLSEEQGGIDFWLTRNRHGTGFWDRGLVEVGDRLTKAANSFQVVSLYVGDDGQIHS
jgi:hypothetical protein